MHEASEDARGPLPLVFGITGHRDLRDEDCAGLEKQVEAVFTDFRSRYPHTPMVLLSPLAEGADRLVARVALRCGARLVAPLPMPREEYEHDFESPESRAEFDALIRQADRAFAVPMVDDNTIENVRDSAARRGEQYALLGAFLIRHCQILVALWNGVKNPESGGTAQVVHFQRDGVPERYSNTLLGTDAVTRSHLDPPEGGPVYHIVTPRRNHPEVVGTPLTLRTYFPGDDIADDDNADVPEYAATVDRILSNMDAFNRNALLLDSQPELTPLRQRSESYLLPDDIAQTLPPELLTLRRRYATADTLAQYFQGRTLRTLRGLSVTVFLAALSFELTAKLAPDNGWLALIFPTLIGCAWVFWFATVSRGQWQDQHQDYRTLAEGLRVAFFWRMAALPHGVADHYLRKQRDELEWIRISIRNFSDEAVDSQGEPVTVDRLDLVQTHWVQDQSRYFTRGAHRDEKELERFESWIRRLIIASPTVAAVTALVGIIPSPLGEWMHHQPVIHKLLIVLVFVLAGVAGVLHTYIDKRALPQHVKQYERMGTVYALAAHRLARRLAEGRILEARQLVQELGRESLAENGDWVMTHRERPVDVPHAG